MMFPGNVCFSAALLEHLTTQLEMKPLKMANVLLQIMRYEGRDACDCCLIT